MSGQTDSTGKTRGAGPNGPAQERVRGGRPFYGMVGGVLVFDSKTPRVPGDPGHAQTFSFPVLYEVIRGFSFENLRTYDPGIITPVLDAALRLQERGVHFIITDCGLFSLYQREISATVDVPFLASALNLIPLVLSTLSPKQKLGVITGHTDYLTPAHLQAAGADLGRLAIAGMETCPEFIRVVVEGANELDVEALRQGTVDVARHLQAKAPDIGAVILECPNLATFRPDIVRALGVPVFDIVLAAEFFAAALSLDPYALPYPYPPHF